MFSQSIAVRTRRTVRQSRLTQIGLIVLLWLAGEAIVRGSGLPVPGSIVGLALTLLLLASGRISLFTLRNGARWFLAEMLLFFVPAVMGVLDHREFLGLVGLKILAIIALGTAFVMLVTGFTVELCLRWTEKRNSSDAVS